MPVKLHWFLPTTGDARGILGAGNVVGAHHRRASAAARRARRRRSTTSARSPARPSSSGFEAALTPTGSWCEDAWVTTAALTQVTRAAEVPGRVPARG